MSVVKTQVGLRRCSRDLRLMEVTSHALGGGGGGCGVVVGNNGLLKHGTQYVLIISHMCTHIPACIHI